MVWDWVIAFSDGLSLPIVVCLREVESWTWKGDIPPLEFISVLVWVIITVVLATNFCACAFVSEMDW